VSTGTSSFSQGQSGSNEAEQLNDVKPLVCGIDKPEEIFLRKNTTVFTAGDSNENAYYWLTGAANLFRPVQAGTTGKSGALDAAGFMSNLPTSVGRCGLTLSNPC